MPQWHIATIVGAKHGDERSKDPEFSGEMRSLFSGSPAGVLTLPALAEALSRIEDLEEGKGFGRGGKVILEGVPLEGERAVVAGT